MAFAAEILDPPEVPPPGADPLEGPAPADPEPPVRPADPEPGAAGVDVDADIVGM